MRVLLFVSLALGTLLSCKPRNSGLSQEGGGEPGEIILKEMMEIRDRREELLSPEGGIAAADDGYSQKMQELFELAGGNILEARYYGASTIGEIAGIVEPKLELDLGSGTKTYTHQDLFLEGLKRFRLPSSPTITCPSTGAKHVAHICVDFNSCTNAIAFFNNFAEGHPVVGVVDNRSEVDQRVIAGFDEVQRLLDEDVRCVARFNDKGFGSGKLLEQKRRLGRLAAGMYRTSNIRTLRFSGRTPTGYAGSKGSQQTIEAMGTSSDHIGDLIHHTEALLKWTETNLYDGKTKLARAENVAATMQEEVLEQPYMQYPAEQRIAILNYVSEPFKGIDSAYQYLLRMRFNLARLNQQDIRPWLSCLEARVDDWVISRRAAAPDMLITKIKDVAIEGCPAWALSPQNGLALMAIMSEQEVLLPFRHYFYRTAVNLVSSIPRGERTPREGTEGPYSVLLRKMKDGIGKADATLEAMMNSASFPNEQPFPKQLIDYEELIATRVYGFHSLYYQVRRAREREEEVSREVVKRRFIMGAKMELNEMRLAMALLGLPEEGLLEVFQGVKPEKDGSILAFPPEQYQTYSDEEKRRAKAEVNEMLLSRHAYDLNLACYAHLFANDRSTFQVAASGVDDQQPWWSGCWEWAFYSWNTEDTARGIYRVLETSAQVTNYRIPQVEEDFVLGAKYFAEKIGAGRFNQKNRVNPLHSYDFTPARDGALNLDILCNMDTADGRVADSVLVNRINHWLEAQHSYNQCRGFTTAFVATSLSLLTMVYTANIAGVVTQMLAPRIAGHSLYALWSTAQSGAGFLTRTMMLSKFFLYNLPVWAIRLTANFGFKVGTLGPAFYVLNTGAMSLAGLVDIWDFDKDLSENLKVHGRGMVSGTMIILILEGFNPVVNVLARAGTSFLFNMGYKNAADRLAAGLAFSSEVALFANIHHVDHWYKEKVEGTVEPDTSWDNEFQMNHYLHAFLMTAAFKIGHKQSAEIRAQREDSAMWKKLVEKDRNMAKLLLENPMEWYAFLGLKNGPKSTKSEITMAVRSKLDQLSKIPNLDARFDIAATKEAFEVLTNPAKKSAYDREFFQYTYGRGTELPADAGNPYKILGIDRQAFDGLSSAQQANEVRTMARIQSQKLVEEATTKYGERPTDAQLAEFDPAFAQIKEAQEILLDPVKRTNTRVMIDNVTRDRFLPEGSSQVSGEGVPSFDYRDAGESI